MKPFDLSKLGGAELIELLKHPNKWWRNQARRLLAEKPLLVDQVAFNRLTSMLDDKGHIALEALWTMFVSETITPAQVKIALAHPNENVRAWIVRLLGDHRKATSEQLESMIQMARNDTSPVVRSQLACTAKRLPDEPVIPLLYELAIGDATDAQVPMLVWWAIEHHVVAYAPITDWLANRANAPMMRDVILERLARRLIAEGTLEGYAFAALLYEEVPEDAHRLIVIRGMNQALQAKRLDKMPRHLAKAFRDRAMDPEKHPEYQQLLLRLGDEKSYQDALSAAGDIKVADAQRLKKFELLAEIHKPDALPVFLDAFQNGKSDALRIGALNALQVYADPKASDIVLTLFPKLTGALRQKAQAMLLSRKETALALLQLADKGTIKPTDLSVDQLRPMLAFNDAEINKLVVKHYGKIGAATAGLDPIVSAMLGLMVCIESPTMPTCIATNMKAATIRNNRVISRRWFMT